MPPIYDGLLANLLGQYRQFWNKFIKSQQRSSNNRLHPSAGRRGGNSRITLPDTLPTQHVASPGLLSATVIVSTGSMGNFIKRAIRELPLQMITFNEAGANSPRKTQGYGYTKPGEMSLQ